MADTYITIIQDEQFPYQFRDPDTGQLFATQFILREVPDEVEKAIRKRHTTVKMGRGGRRDETLDARAYGNDVIDYAIVGWDRLVGLSHDRDGRAVKVDLSCTREHKIKLPDRIKADIMRMALSKEAGLYLDDEGVGDPAMPAPGSKS